MMEQKKLISLTVLTVVIVAVTAFAVSQYRQGTALQINRTALDPQWEEKAEQVFRVELDGPDGTVTLWREPAADPSENDQWRVAERHDYAADNGKIWQLISEYGELELVEPRTADPELYERLFLRDRSQPDAQSLAVSFADGNGNLLSAALFGKPRKTSGQGERQFFLRRVGEAQTWVAAGRLDPARLPSAWLNREVIDISQQRVREVTINHPGKQLSRVAREDSQQPMQLQTAPDGQQPDETAVNAIAYGLQKLPLVDVNTVDEAGLDWDDVIEVQFATFDGLTVTVRVQSKDLGIVARFSAVGEGDSAAEARELNARLSPWVFVLPNHTVSTFTRTPEELLISGDDHSDH